MAAVEALQKKVGEIQRKCSHHNRATGWSVARPLPRLTENYLSVALNLARICSVLGSVVDPIYSFR